ncbi:Hypothetical protein J6889_04350 [Nakaseomyces glabratus]
MKPRGHRHSITRMHTICERQKKSRKNLGNSVSFRHFRRAMPQRSTSFGANCTTFLAETTDSTRQASF